MTREELDKLKALVDRMESMTNAFINGEQDILNKAIETLGQEPILDKIRAEITAIAINGQVDEHTMFIRSGEQVKQMALGIIDKYKAESEG